MPVSTGDKVLAVILGIPTGIIPAIFIIFGLAWFNILNDFTAVLAYLFGVFFMSVAFYGHEKDKQDLLDAVKGRSGE